MKTFIYRTIFNLTDYVTDFYAAREYLSEDDMTKYLKNNVQFAEDINSIVWVLTEKDGGYIELKTNRELTEAELNEVSDWVCGQNSDGLGEEFEQQQFAEIYDEDEYVGMASFDWKTNEYKFKLEWVEE